MPIEAFCPSKMAGENVTPAIISNVFKFIEKSVGVLTLEIRDGQEDCQ